MDTLHSILYQDYSNIELIVSDDASGLFDIKKIEAYIQANKGSNIKSVHINQNFENMGTVAHMNFAAKMAHGKYIKFISCGDKFFNKNSLSLLCDFMNQNNVCVITSMSAVCSEDLKTVYYNFPSSRRVNILNENSGLELFYIIAFSNFISAAACLFRRSFFETDGGFDEEYKLLEDYPTWLKLLRNGTHIPCLDVVTVYYSVGGVSSSNGTAFEAENLKKDMILCFEKEILPSIEEFTCFKKSFLLYEYRKLTYYENVAGIYKIGFLIRYLPYGCFRKGKAVAKVLLKKSRKN